MAGGLEDRVGLVTGGGSGIGRASALAMAAQGARVVVVDRDADAAATTVAEIDPSGELALALDADVADPDALARVVAAGVDRFGRLDAVHANAAVQWFGDALECTMEEWDRTLAVNLTGVLHLARVAIPEFKRAGGGALVATCSDCAVRTCNTATAYTVAKTGLIGLIRSIAVDFGPDGVRANLVTPGVTDTPGLRRLYSLDGNDPEEGISRAAALSPLGRIGTPQDLGDVVAFLVSDRARFITGENIMVDGGMTVTYGAD